MLDFNKIWDAVAEFTKGLTLYRFLPFKSRCSKCNTKLYDSMSFFCEDCDVEFYNSYRAKIKAKRLISHANNTN